MDLTALRKQIDEIDAQLVALFVKRMDISAHIGLYKKANGLPIIVPAREEEKLRAVSQLAGPEMAEYTKSLYDAIFEESRLYQQKIIEDIK